VTGALGVGRGPGFGLRLALVFALALVSVLTPASLSAQWLLLPMDRVQSDHLRAYGVVFRTLERGESGEWLLNYRDGSFLIPDSEGARRDAALAGVRIEPVGTAGLQRIRSEMGTGNRASVPLESLPRIAIYTPPNTPPWGDAVTLALTYAGIPYDEIWDAEVLDGRLADYDWVHLHHEDFTGQYSKFFIAYAGTPWMRDEVARNEEMARRYGFSDVPDLKKAVAEGIRSFVLDGGFLFAMCSATETLDLALAAHGIDITASFANGRPPTPGASERMDWDRALAFQGARVETSASVNAFSDIDTHQVNTQNRASLRAFTLFEFSAQVDPVASMLVQNHESVIPDFYGLTTAFRADRLKPGAVHLARDGDRVKYVTGTAGKGTWTFYGGHDPEDREHQVGDGPTNLELHPNSAGYRLILNNVLFPAAKPRPLRT
jgi:hypothetical protein